MKIKPIKLKSFNAKKFLGQIFNLKSIKIHRTLRARIVLILMLMAVLPLVASGIVISNYMKDTLTEEAAEKAKTIIQNIDDSITIFMNQKKSTVKFIANTNIIKSMDKEKITEFLTTVTSNDSDFSRFYVADVDGYFFTAPYDIATAENNNVSNEAWFKQALNSKRIYLSNPRKDALSDRLIISMSYPIVNDDDEVIGVLNAEIPLTTFSVMFMNMNIGNGAISYLTDSEGYIIAHVDPSLPSRHVSVLEHQFVKDALAGKSGFGIYEIDYADSFISYSLQPDTHWGIFVQQPEHQALAHVNEVSKIIFSTAGIIALISLVIGVFSGNFVAKPILKIVKVSKNVAEGNLQEQINIKDSTEIGILATSFNLMIESLKNLVQEVVSAAENISASSQELAAGSEQSTQSSQQVAKAVEQIAAGASEQVQKLTDITEMIQKLVEVNSQLEEKSRASAALAEQMSANAISSQDKINMTTAKMEAIKSSVERSNTIMEDLDNKVGEIGNISGIIKEIVDQTNLLALNASIEAARAGEHGRGFAVVAAEVRKLADQSGEAAKQIAEIVKQIQKSSKIAVDAMSESGKQVHEGQGLITETNEKIHDIMQQFQVVAQSAQETAEEITSQNKKLEQIVEMAQNISVISQETAAGTEEVSASAQEQTATMESVASSAQELAQLAEKLTSMVNRFKV